jgi:hypothetical protein
MSAMTKSSSEESGIDKAVEVVEMASEHIDMEMLQLALFQMK